jgi:hypothetical protein
MQVQLDRLTQRYDFSSWSAPRGPGSLTWGFRLNGDEIPGWKPHRIQQVDLPGEPHASLSVWRPVEGNGALLALNVYECDDETAARRYLLRLLGEFQGPQLTRVASPGDISFAAGAVGLLFARGNLVALVRSIERTPAPVAETAARLDRVLAGGSEPTGKGPVIDTLDAQSDVPAGQPVPITISATDPSGATVWYHFASATGRFTVRGRQPAFLPSQDGPHEIEVTAVGAAGSTRRSLKLGGD